MTAPPQPPSARPWLVAFVVCSVVVFLAMRFVDHPVADYVQAHLHATPFGRNTNRVLEYWPLGAAPLIIWMLVIGLRALAGAPPGPGSRDILLGGWAAMWALALCAGLKHIFGRAEVDALYVARHIDDFHWFHGSGDHLGFPSGTMSAVGALAGVMWTVLPRLRWVAIAGSAVVFLALVIVNGHWVADLIGGTFLGVLVAAMMLRLDGRHT